MFVFSQEQAMFQLSSNFP